jgi:L-arabinose isomerase
MFTIDYANNAVFMSHMGEANAAMARTDRKIRLVSRSSPITRTRCGQLALVTTLQPGPATLFALTQGPGQRWRMLASKVEIADFSALGSMDVPYFNLVPDRDVREFLTAYAKMGGPHHNALCFGDARRRVEMTAKILDADYCEV